MGIIKVERIMPPSRRERESDETAPVIRYVELALAADQIARIEPSTYRTAFVRNAEAPDPHGGYSPYGWPKWIYDTEQSPLPCLTITLKDKSSTFYQVRGYFDRIVSQLWEIEDRAIDRFAAKVDEMAAGIARLEERIG